MQIPSYDAGVFQDLPGFSTLSLANLGCDCCWKLNTWPGVGRERGVPHTPCICFGSVWLDEMWREDVMYRIDSVVSSLAVCGIWTQLYILEEPMKCYWLVTIYKWWPVSRKAWAWIKSRCCFDSVVWPTVTYAGKKQQSFRGNPSGNRTWGIVLWHVW